jgi:ribosomal protein S18 acetylase RimI-like enzyme
VTDPTITYRPIVLPDDASLCAANHRDACLLSYGHDRATPSKSAYLDWLARRIVRFPDGHLLAHLGGDRFLGQLELEARGRVGYIDLFYVAAPFRRMGFGRRLHDRALEYFRAHGCDTLELHVARANTPALRFYQSLGYKTSRDPADNHDELWMMRGELAALTPPSPRRRRQTQTPGA